METTERDELLRQIRDLQCEVDKWKQRVKAQTYGLVWLDVPEAFEAEAENSIPILEEVKERAINDATPDQPTHMIIEGDNYHALTCLNYTHRGKIDVIYIDPPYNTGNDGFTYKDKRVMDRYPDGKLVPKDDPLRHSTWLSFMHKRLVLARNLLSDRGVIFISIDDNEQANLKLLCDKVFGEENLTAQMVWEQGKKSMAAQIAINHEYCFVYCKDKQRKIDTDRNENSTSWREKKQGLDTIYREYNRLKKIYKDDYSAIEKGMISFYKSLPENNPAKQHEHYRRVDENGLFFPDNISQGTGQGGRFDIIHPLTKLPCKVPNGGWRFSESRLPELLLNNRIHFGKDENTVPCLKRYLKETEYEVAASVFYKDGRGASNRLQELLGAKVFDHPKDEEVIAKLLAFCTSTPNNSSTILDFFAGSGTTLHATLQLNAADGGKRQCILVNNNENGICERVTYERNRRVMQGYTNAKGEEVAGIGGRMRYYRTAFAGRNRAQQATDGDRVALSRKAGYLLAIGENTLTEVLCTESYQFFTDEVHRHTAVYFTGSLADFGSFVAEVANVQTDMQAQVAVYIFGWGSVESFANEFDSLRGLTLKAIPQPILEVYQSLQ